MENIPPQPKVNPSIVVFDLDACCWSPDLYLMSGSPPFEYNKKTEVVTNSANEKITLCPGVAETWNEIMTNPEFQKTSIAIASRCWYYDWAIKLLNLYEVEPGKKMMDCCKYMEIYDRNKKNHFKSIKAKSGVEFEDMLFFDDMRDNINDAKSLGVVSVLCSDGFSRRKWKEGLMLFEKSKSKKN